MQGKNSSHSQVSKSIASLLIPRVYSSLPSPGTQILGGIVLMLPRFTGDHHPYLKICLPSDPRGSSKTHSDVHLCMFFWIPFFHSLHVVIILSSSGRTPEPEHVSHLSPLAPAVLFPLKTCKVSTLLSKVPKPQRRPVHFTSKHTAFLGVEGNILA